MRSFHTLRFMLILTVLTSGLCTTAAWSQDHEGPPWEATRRYLFVQSAQSFKIDRGTLTLNGVAPTTTFFADRPQRTFGHVRNVDFVELWSQGGNSLADTPPDATLSVLGEDGEPQQIVLGLSNPRIEGSGLMYDVEIVGEDRLKEGSACVLFIDPTQTRAAVRKEETEPTTVAPINDRDRRARQTLDTFMRKDPGLKRFAENSAGYAIFPSVAKGAFVVGGARGDGVVYDKSHHVIGYSTLTQGTVGLQVGGQEYSEIIFFENDASLSHFKRGNAEFSAQASAVAVTAGASADAKYAAGVAIFTMAKGGLMLEASVGGQGFSFDPVK
jgi:lipid-binding SYLF domain-containing protein